MNASRRKAMLEAMQLEVWRPRIDLPWAAPARPEPKEDFNALPTVPTVVNPVFEDLKQPPPAVSKPEPEPAAVVVPLRPQIVLSAPPSRFTKPLPRLESSEVKTAAPRFVLQLLQAGPCLLLLEPPMGEPLQAREGAAQLLRDLVLAAGLPEARSATELITWPLLSERSGIAQDLPAARQYVQAVLQAQQAASVGQGFWFFGEVPARIGAGLDIVPESPTQVVLEPFGSVLLLPSLTQLMQEPTQKAQVWHLLYQASLPWTSEHE